ncbi:MAG: hemerythrin family protein [Burkholderiales bacterium]|nr:hemerythrin family protein [Burkholderiales bacterium]
MTQFFWTDDLSTGSAQIDGDHHVLVDLVNALIETMETGQDGKRMAKAMNDLIAYTGEHFRREDALMERIEYVAVLAHQAAHTKLLAQLVELNGILDAGGKINVPAVSNFLNEWLRDHILSEDMKLAAALKSQPETERLQQAH